MIGLARILMRSATAIVVGLTSVSKGQTPTHLAFLIGYLDGSQIVLLICGRDDTRCSSGLKGQGMRGGLVSERNIIEDGEGTETSRAEVIKAESKTEVIGLVIFMFCLVLQLTLLNLYPDL